MTDCFFFSRPYLFILLTIMCWLGLLAHYGKENNDGHNGHPCISPDFIGIVFSLLLCMMFSDSFMKESIKGGSPQFAMIKFSWWWIDVQLYSMVLFFIYWDVY